MYRILFLHGWGQNKNTFDSLKGIGSKTFEGTSFDLPGFGSEPPLLANANLDSYTAWVDAKIAHKTFDYIYGHSFGGRIAIRLARKSRPENKGLILSGTPGLYRPSMQVRLKIAAAKIAKLLQLRKVSYLGSKELSDAQERGIGELFKTIVNTDQADDLPKITMPVLMLRGQHDSAVSRIVYQLMEEMITSSCTHVTLSGVGHNIHTENPYLTFGLLKKFTENVG